MELNCEPLTGGIYVYSSEEHRFGTDAFLLASFAGWRKKDLVTDLGTGCGIIPMIMQRDDPPKRIWGVEIQEQGIRQFRLGIEKSGLSEENVTPVLADLKQLWNGAPLEK
jgi:tRNA1(Val) A37 N6-methylase TrmN6